MSVSVHAQVWVQTKCSRAATKGVVQRQSALMYGVTFRNICSSSPQTKESHVKHRSWKGLDGFARSPLSEGRAGGCRRGGFAFVTAKQSPGWQARQPGHVEVMYRGLGEAPEGSLPSVLPTQAQSLFIYSQHRENWLAQSAVRV